MDARKQVGKSVYRRKDSGWEGDDSHKIERSTQLWVFPGGTPDRIY